MDPIFALTPDPRQAVDAMVALTLVGMGAASVAVDSRRRRRQPAGAPAPAAVGPRGWGGWALAGAGLLRLVALLFF